MDTQLDALDTAYRALGQVRAMADVISLLEEQDGKPQPLKPHTLEGLAAALDDAADAIGTALDAIR